jgi:hypothetical protein
MNCFLYIGWQVETEIQGEEIAVHKAKELIDAQELGQDDRK